MGQNPASGTAPRRRRLTPILGGKWLTASYGRRVKATLVGVFSTKRRVVGKRSMYDTHTVFLMFERGVQAIVPRGSRKCRKAMRKMDEAFSEDLPHPVEQLRKLDNEARAMLRIRCGLCPSRCREPLM